MAYRLLKPDAKPEESLQFESVIPVGDAQVAHQETKTGYTVEARLSCDHIELKHLSTGLRGDIGILWGNEAGLVTERRAYLFNHSPAASIVSDTPNEAELDRPNGASGSASKCRRVIDGIDGIRHSEHQRVPVGLNFRTTRSIHEKNSDSPCCRVVVAFVAGQLRRNQEGRDGGLPAGAE